MQTGYKDMADLLDKCQGTSESYWSPGLILGGEISCKKCPGNMSFNTSTSMLTHIYVFMPKFINLPPEH